MVDKQHRPAPERLRIALLSQVGSQMFRIAVSICLAGWTARYLGPADLGKLSYVSALVGVLSPLGSLGVKGSLAVLLCEQPPQPGLVATALWIEVVGTGVIALVLAPLAWASGEPVLAGLMGLAVIANLFNSAEVFEVELLNRGLGSRLAKAGFVQTLTGAGLSVVALLSQAPLLVFGAVQTMAVAVWAILLTAAGHGGQLRRLLGDASWTAAVALIRRGWPLLLAGLSVMVYMKSDQVMLAWLRGPEEVGQYSVAARAAESLYFLPVVLAGTFLPQLAKGTGRFNTDPALRALYRTAWMLGMAMALSTSLVLPEFVPLVFGSHYEPAKRALFWLGPAAFAVATGCASGAWLNVQSHTNLIAARSVIGAGANIILNLILIPGEGAQGAAIATSLSYLASVYCIGACGRPILANALRLLAPI